MCTHIAHTKCVANSIELCVIYCSHRYFAFLRTLTLLHTGVRCAQIRTERFFWVDIEFSFQRERRASEKINYQNNRLTKHVGCTCLRRHCRRRHRHIEYILELVEQVFEQNVSFSCELIQIELFVFRLCLHTATCYIDVCASWASVKEKSNIERVVKQTCEKRSKLANVVVLLLIKFVII